MMYNDFADILEYADKHGLDIEAAFYSKYASETKEKRIELLKEFSTIFDELRSEIKKEGLTPTPKLLIARARKFILKEDIIQVDKEGNEKKVGEMKFETDRLPHGEFGGITLEDHNNDLLYGDKKPKTDTFGGIVIPEEKPKEDTFGGIVIPKEDSDSKTLLFGDPDDPRNKKSDDQGGGPKF